MADAIEDVFKPEDPEKCRDFETVEDFEGVWCPHSLHYMASCRTKVNCPHISSDSLAFAHSGYELECLSPHAET